MSKKENSKMVKLFIEIESENEDTLKSLLNHINKEISLGPSYKNYEIEHNSYSEGDWLHINKDGMRGKYHWKKNLGKKYNFEKLNDNEQETKRFD